jgi:signal peptidase II
MNTSDAPPPTSSSGSREEDSSTSAPQQPVAGSPPEAPVVASPEAAADAPPAVVEPAGVEPLVEPEVVEPAVVEPAVAPVEPAKESAAIASSTGRGAKTSERPASVPAAGPAPSFVFLVVVSVIVLVSDLWTKWWAVQNLEKDGFRLPAKEIIKGRLQFVLARNPGGAWGMFHDQPEKIRKPFFVIVSIVAVAVIVGMFRKLDPKQRALKWGLPLVLGGALGNLVDRVRYGQVIDFIDVVYWKKPNGIEMHWPTFNVADIAICIGVILMAVDFLFPHKRPVARRVPAAKKAT